MIFLIKLPPLLGAIIAVLLSLGLTCALFVTAHIFFREKRPKEYKTIAQQMALRIGTMHALVMALVFSTLTGELKNLNNLSDAEAMSAANIYYILRNSQSEEATKLRSLIPIYLKTVLEKDWEELSQMPYKLPAWELITKMQAINFGWKTTNSSDEMLKSYVFNNLNTIMMGFMFYGIAVLDKPFLSRVIQPVSFEVMYKDISKDASVSPLEEKQA